MKKDIFDFLDYRQYILLWIQSKPKKGRGIRALLAKAIHSPTSHVSQVLNGQTEFSFEQAEELNHYLEHTNEQSEYFLLLIALSKAGTKKLKDRILYQIHHLRKKNLNLKDRFEIKENISIEDQAVFYSSWHYVAIHILLTIERYQTKEELSRYLNISPIKVKEILNFLLKLGLVTYKNNHFQVGTSRIHLGSDSPMISKHHINWRLQAIQSLEKEFTTDNLHYSSVISISQKDVMNIKSTLVKSIENTKEIIKESKEEEIYSLCLDFFKI